MNELNVGSEVHYRQGDNTCSKARVTHVHNQEVVDLNILSDGGQRVDYARKTVVYRAAPVPYSWHWPEDDMEIPEE